MTPGTDVRPPGGWLPADALRDEEVQDEVRVRVSKQLNVRLTPHWFGILREAADLCGVTPTTLARMLIHRGALAIVEERHQDMVRFAAPDRNESRD